MSAFLTGTVVLINSLFMTSYGGINIDNCVFYHSDVLQPIQNNSVGMLHVGQEMEVEFYFTVNSLCPVNSPTHGYCHVLQIGPGNNDFLRTPSIFITSSSIVSNPNRFLVFWSINGATGDGFYIPDNSAILDGTEHLLHLKLNETNRIATIDGGVVYQSVGVYPNTDYQSSDPKPIWISNNYWNASNISLRETCLYSNYPTPNPTTAPSISPTIAPSVFPSNSPTQHPINFPSNYPSLSPTIIPSQFPSTSPSSAPLAPGEPTQSPLTLTPITSASQPTTNTNEATTYQPTIYPTTGSPTDHEKEQTQQTEHSIVSNTELDSQTDSEGSTIPSYIYIIIGSVCIIALILCIVCVVYKKYMNNKMSTEINTTTNVSVNQHIKTDIAANDNDEDIIGYVDLQRDQTDIKGKYLTKMNSNDNNEQQHNNIFIDNNACDQNEGIIQENNENDLNYTSAKQTIGNNDESLSKSSSSINKNTKTNNAGLNDDDNDKDEDLYTHEPIMDNQTTTNGYTNNNNKGNEYETVS